MCGELEFEDVNTKNIGVRTGNRANLATRQYQEFKMRSGCCGFGAIGTISRDPITGWPTTLSTSRVRGADQFFVDRR